MYLPIEANKRQIYQKVPFYVVYISPRITILYEHTRIEKVLEMKLELLLLMKLKFY